MNNSLRKEYDVVIVGSNLAGVCLARHLMLKLPNLKVALIAAPDHGRAIKNFPKAQSLSEIANLFICKELGLYEYMIENHPPKFGLNFHWPKKPSQTYSLNDYYHIWTNRQPHLAASQINCAQFELDLLKMNREMGVHLYTGRVVDLTIAAAGVSHGIVLDTDGERLAIQATHLIKATEEPDLPWPSTVTNPAFLPKPDTGSAWVRVKNIDRLRFHSGYDPKGSSCSHYYATNYWLGTGHWVWMIPTDKRSQEIVLGITHAAAMIPPESLNNIAKFSSFLQANHSLVADILNSGEILEFHSSEQTTPTNPVLWAAENFYVIPPTVANDDTFYAMDTAAMAIALESITRLIGAQQSGDADLERKRAAYHKFNQAFLEDLHLLSSYRTHQCGHASIMSWRIYLESMIWFGAIIPLYVGKWYLDVDFIEDFLSNYRPIFRQFLAATYELFNRLLQQENTNLGLMDCYRGDQLWGHYHTLTHFDTFWENAKYEPGRCNIFASWKSTSFYLAVALIKLRWQNAGWRGILSGEYLSQLWSLLTLRRKSGEREMKYQAQFKNIPSNTEIAEMIAEFKNYKCQRYLQYWTKQEASS